MREQDIENDVARFAHRMEAMTAAALTGLLASPAPTDERAVAETAAEVAQRTLLQIDMAVLDRRDRLEAKEKKA